MIITFYILVSLMSFYLGFKYSERIYSKNLIFFKELFDKLKEETTNTTQHLYDKIMLFNESVNLLKEREEILNNVIKRKEFTIQKNNEMFNMYDEILDEKLKFDRIKNDQIELDRIFDKINDSGIQSLTEDEVQFLKKYSNKFNDK